MKVKKMKGKYESYNKYKKDVLVGMLLGMEAMARHDKGIIELLKEDGLLFNNKGGEK